MRTAVRLITRLVVSGGAVFLLAGTIQWPAAYAQRVRYRLLPGTW